MEKQPLRADFMGKIHSKYALGVGVDSPFPRVFYSNGSARAGGEAYCIVYSDYENVSSAAEVVEKSKILLGRLSRRKTVKAIIEIVDELKG